MAVHSFDKETQREYESASAFRAQLDREAERHAREMYRREEERNEANLSREEQLRIEREEQRRREESANKVIGDNIMRGMRGNLKDDPYGREAYNTFIEFSALRNAGMVMGSLLANTAAEASYVASLEDARDDEFAHKTNDTSVVEAAQARTEQTLKDYITSVEESRAAYTGTATTYHVEFEETRREAQRAQETATRAYETIKTRADEAIRTADDTYTRSLASITRDAEMAIARRDEVVQTASHSFDTEVRQIASTHSNGGEAIKLMDTAAQRQQEAVDTARKNYDSEVQQIRANHDSATAERMIESASQTRDLAIAAASKQYVAEVRQIAEHHMGEEAVKLVDTATQRRETAITTASREYDTTHERLETQRSVATETHRAEIARQTDRIADAERKRDTVINHQNDVIRTSQIKRDEAIADARQEMTNAQNKLATYEQHRGEIPTAAASLQRALNPVEGMRASVTLETYAQGIEKVQIHIGTEMAMRMGTDDEKRIVAAIMSKGDEATPQEMAKLRSISMQYAGDITAGAMTAAYSIDAMTAAKLGTDSERKFITAVLDKGEAATADEKRQVEAIMKKYEPEMAHDFGTTGCRDAVASIENFRHFLQKENATIDAEMSAKTNALKDIESRIAANQAAIQKLESIQTQLSTGKGLDGKPLTEGQIKELKQQLGKAAKDAAGAADVVAGLTKQKNAMKASINQMATIKARNVELIKGIKAQSDRLKKNGKAVALQLIASKGKDVKGGVERSTRKFNKSIDKLQKEHLRKINKGDILWEEMNRVTVKAMMNKRKFEKAVAIASYARNITSPMAAGFGKGVRLLGKQTGLTNLKEKALHSNKTVGGWVDKSRAKQLERQQKKIEEAKKLKAENEKRKAAGLKPLKSKEEQRIEKIGNIINLPMTLRNKPKEFIRTQTTKLTKKATNKLGRALGKTRLGKWANKTFSPGLQALKKFQQRLQKLNPINFINKVKSKIIGWLLSILSSVLGFVMQIVGYVAAAVGIVLLIIIIVLLILMLIFAAIAAILNFFQQMGAHHQSLVKNQPAFLLEQAVNYRDSELQMLEMFRSNNADTWEQWGLVPCNDPFYLAMSYKLGDTVIESPEGTLSILEPYNSSFKNWYFDTRMGQVKTDSNTRWKTDGDGKYLLTVTGPTGTQWTYHVTKSSITTQDLKDIYNWHVSNRRYDRISMNYYTSEALESGEAYGSYVLKSDAVPVGYEISNAKDALAVTDAVYINKQDTMQKFEVFAYLGVGKYQMAKTTDNKPLMNLFWASHKPIYLSGTSVNDVWYHKTKDNGQIDANARWDGSGAAYACDTQHQITITQQYETDNKVAPHSSPDLLCNTWTRTRINNGKKSHTVSSADAKKDYYYEYWFQTGTKPSTSGYKLNSSYSKCNSTTLNNAHNNGKLGATIWLEQADTDWGIPCFRVYDSTRTYIYDILTFNTWPGISNRSHMRLTWNSTEGCYVFYDFEKIPNGTITLPQHQCYSFKDYDTTCGCEKVTSGTTPTTVTTKICMGHLDLKMAMIVSSIGGDADADTLEVQESFLDDAARVTPVPPGQSKGNFFFTWDTDTGIFGFGDVDVAPFDPSVDLAEDGEIRNLAKGKAQLEDEKYELENEDDDPSAEAENQDHLTAEGEWKSFKRLRKSPQNTLLFGMHFGGRTFYVESYTSGLQKDLHYYEWLSNAPHESASLLSIKMNTATGKPYIG